MRETSDRGGPKKARPSKAASDCQDERSALLESPWEYAPLFLPREDALPLPNHPLRSFVSDEMHVRKLPPVSSPARLIQFVMQGGEDAAATGLAHMRRLAEMRGGECSATSRYHVLRIEPLELVFEAHSEFCTYIFIAVGRMAPLPLAELERLLPPGWLTALPGRIVQATQIAFLPPSFPDPNDAQLAQYFFPKDLVLCDLAGGKARLWSDFDLHEDGLGRLILADRGLKGFEAADLLQRLLEQGHYRNMALLGLPQAQHLTPELTRLDQRLSRLTTDIGERQQDDDRLLGEVSYLSAELARLMAATRYRMSASRAYAQLSADRLSSLDVRPVAGYPALTDFTERRLAPAVRTCESFASRLDELSQRVAWTSTLLSTRVGISLERQNRDQLCSMNRRVALQLRLQHMVEGLSTVAISYYAVGLLLDVARGLRVALPIFPDEMIGGLLPAPITALVWYILHRARRHLYAPRDGS